MDEQEGSRNLNIPQSHDFEAGLTTHEGAHLAKFGVPVLSLLEHSEAAALFVESATYQGLHYTDNLFNLWNESWATLDKGQIETKRSAGIQQELDRQKGIGKDDNPKQ